MTCQFQAGFDSIPNALGRHDNLIFACSFVVLFNACFFLISSVGAAAGLSSDDGPAPESPIRSLDASHRNGLATLEANLYQNYSEMLLVSI
jgi:hypothetical protein